MSNRYKVIIEIDKQCSGCKWCCVVGDDIDSLECSKHKKRVKEEELCDDWECNLSLNDWIYLNPKIIYGEEINDTMR